MDGIIQFITDFLGTPAILIGVIILVGLLAQKKSADEVIRGTLKGILGFIVLGSGAAILMDSLAYFGTLFEEAFGLTGVVPNNEAITALALDTYATITAGIMVIGMAANILIARFSKLKYIFLTGHHTLYMAALFAVVLTVAGLNEVLVYIVGGLGLGLVMAVFPALAQPTMRKITGNDQIALGHFSTVTYIISAQVGKLVGKGSKSTEEATFPKGLSFLRDSSIAIAITMLVMFLIVTIIAGPDYVENGLGVTQHFLIFSIIQSITFAAGVYIVLQGVRMVIAEIVPAFKGFSEKIVPDAKPAIDCPIVFPFAPNAVLIGFVSSFIGGVIGMIILILVDANNVILPGVVPHFFVGATAGVFGNATGGRRGAVVGSFVNGLLLAFLPLLLMPVLGDLGFANTTFGDVDFVAVGVVVGSLANVNAYVTAGVIVALFTLPFIHNMVTKNKKSVA